MEDHKELSDSAHGLFKAGPDAMGVYNELIAAGVAAESISIVMSEDTRSANFDINKVGETRGSDTAGSAGQGALLGGATGGITAAIAASTGLLLPGIGLVIAGPLLAGLVGAASGGLAGATIGSIIGKGYPKARAADYEKGVQEGDVLISVTPATPGQEAEVMRIFRQHNGRQLHASESPAY